MRRREDAKRREEKRLAEEVAAEAEDKQERDYAYAKLIGESKKEKEKAANELAKRMKHHPAAKQRQVDVVITPRPSGSKNKSFKSKSVISDDSEDAGVEVGMKERGVKRKRTIKMIAKNATTPDSDDGFEPDSNREDDDAPQSPPNPSQPRSACSRCSFLGKAAECRPQSTQRRTQACELCHLQRQRCSWSGNNASRQARGKRVKIEVEELYEGPASRIAARGFGGSEVLDQLDHLKQRLGALERYASRSTMALERMVAILVWNEQREQNVQGEGEMEGEEEEDQDGEGEEDEEEVEGAKRREEIREGKKRAE
ncbi:hypothetical protein F5050DRAFT_1812736 [Lentinula boryana]|uniref:Zn(2)-C6 fungal-type domain-containing protein n=1 Tax=Lentinula boryana TaxID=40481 RepID=A0ABQ8PXW7_9AGAR|nr:hypothetical protein F5050DRAFT_1812736 [Lentinula boryana]